LGNKGVTCSQQAWGTTDTATDADTLLIVIDSAEHPLLLDPTQRVFEQTKQLLLHGKNVLWVSFQYSPPSAEAAALKNMVNGMARVVRRENPGLRLITVDVQDQIQLSGSGKGSLDLERIVQTLAEIAMSSFWPVSEKIRVEELEYTICDGKLTIPRVIPDDRFASYIDSRNQDQDQGAASMVECKYLNRDRPLMFDVQVPGLLNTIRFVDNNMMAEPLGPDQIEVQAYAHGVNFKDVFIALGQMQPGTAMTGEAAGVVTAVGSNVQSLWKPGDRVLGLMVAPFGNLVRINSTGIVAIPDSITFADAASISIVYYTAWYCLTHVARLEKGQTVLIHAASGGVGQAAIQIAKLIGAEIFATVGSVPKRKLIQDQYGIPESHVFSSHSRRFKKGIVRSTQGKGVDVVLNSLSGELLMDSWDCVAQFGTFLEIGKTDIYGRSQLNMANFEKQATFAAVDTSHMYRLRPEYVTRGLKEIFAMVDKGLLKPVYPVTTYPISRIEETFRLIAARKHVGKLVVVADEQTVVQAPRPKAPPL
jgi:NADPH:quinone reductase-like Zn-dependent oxidoreductase